MKAERIFLVILGILALVVGTALAVKAWMKKKAAAEAEGTPDNRGRGPSDPSPSEAAGVPSDAVKPLPWLDKLGANVDRATAIYMTATRAIKK